MAVFTVPGWLQNAGTVHTAAQMRNYIGAFIAGTNGSATALIGRGGIHRDFGGQMGVAQTGSPSMAVQVDSGACWIPGTEAASQGSYGVVNDASTTLSITTAHATLPRIDIVQARVRDSFYSGVNNDAVLDVKAGTPNASPTAPSPDANALVLAEVLVGAGVTSIVNANITSKRKWLTAVGGVMQANLTTDLPASTDIGTGQLVYNIQTKELVLWDSTFQVIHQVNPAYQTVEGKDTSVTNGSTTSNTFVNSLTTSGIRGVSFIAPPSGKVLVTGMAGGQNNNANPTFLSFEVRTGGTIGSGTVVLASNENTASENNSSDLNRAYRHKTMGLVTGLTAGTTYNACLTYRGTGASTFTYQRRIIIVQPLPY